MNFTGLMIAFFVADAILVAVILTVILRRRR